MRHVRFGRTGLTVSRLCLGTMTFGLQCEEPTSLAILDRAVAGGITFIDTADVYPLGGGLDTVGRTEEIIGRWLQPRRHEVVVATKGFGATSASPWDRGNSRKHLLDAIEASLRRLRPAVQRAVAEEHRVVISALAELESAVQLRAAWLGGRLTRPQYRRLTERLRHLNDLEPFAVQPLPGTIFQMALRQRREESGPHVRTLDLLHLAAMEELGLRRLMTHDAPQADAAAARGYAVMSPGWDGVPGGPGDGGGGRR